MMSLIYEPKGKAREYSPLALNPYSGGCDHGCTYCYCASIMRGAWGTTPKARDLTGLDREANRASRQVLLSFMSDPYCTAEETHRNTRKALNVLRGERCSVAILTKGGTRCLADLEMFKKWPDARIKIGATLTFAKGSKAREWEPGAAHPADRLEALKQLHENGVKTWASIEPVIEADESLAIIWASLPYTDGYKVGKLNHSASSVDWRAFGVAAVDMIRDAGRSVYVKVDLRPFFPDGYLRPEETANDALTLPDRPSDARLI